MDVLEVTKEEYSELVKEPFSVFDTIEFCELNKPKVDELKYLIFNDGKNRFGLIAGIKDGVIKAPFSAPYACFSSITKNNKISQYNNALKTFVEYAKKKSLQKIRVTLPPSFYDYNHLSNLYNSFYVYGFQIRGCDLNFQYNLNNFDENYEMSIDPKGRQKLRASMKNGLIFEKTDDIELAYDVIKQNRDAKGYPLWMKIKDVYDTIKIIEADFFLVKDSDGKAIASAMVYHVTKDNVQVIYWGNLEGTDNLKPMNFMAYKVMEYYDEQGKEFFDIGPSTEFSVPNFGLCDFKQAIGCDTSAKITFELDL